MEPEPPAPLAVSPPPPGEEVRLQEALAAKRKLMLLVRSHPEVLQALQLRKRADDAAIMKALGKFNNLFEILRLAGCSIPEATRAEQLWDLAVQAPKAKRPKRSNAWIWYCAGGIVAALILIFVSVIILQLTQATRGYEVGSCYISLFTNSTCMQASGSCLMEVAVRSGDLFLVKSAWPLPLEHTGANGDLTTYFGDPFRCCNDEQGHVPTCCDLVSGGVEQRTAETFCDSWGSIGKVDWTGQRCHIGAWPCLFTVVPGGYTGEMIDELMYFAQPDVSSYVAVVVSLAVFLLLLVLVPCLRKYCRCDCNFDLRQDDEAELYDPDDPNSDWGQAVQEALQEEYKRKEGGGLCAKLLTFAPQQRLPRLHRVLCALCRRKSSASEETSAPSTPAPASRKSARSSSKISQGRASRISRGSKSLPASPSSATAREKPPLGEEKTRHARSSQVPEAPLIETEDEPKVQAPGFVDEGSHRDEGVKKLPKWDAMDKDLNSFSENDIHPGFQLGNLSSVARLAQQQRQSLFMPIVEPIPKASAKAYNKNTLHYCSSSFRESRQKRRAKKRPATVPEGFPSGKLQWTQDRRLVIGREMFQKQTGKVRGQLGQRAASPMLE